MNAPLIGALIQGAVQIFTDKKAFKENLKKPSTLASSLPGLVLADSVVSNGIVPAGDMETAITQIVSGLLFIGLFLLRKYQNTH